MNGQGNASKRALALQLRKTTNLTVRQIAVKVNANKTTVGLWLKGVKPGQDRTGQDRTAKIIVRPGIGTGQDRTGQRTRDKAPGAVPGVQDKKDRTGQGEHGQSKFVQDTLEKAALTVKKVRAKKKKKKPVYIPATIERIDPEPIPDPEETQETADLEEKPKRKSGFGVWALLIILVIVIVVVIIGLIDKRKEQFDLSEQEQKPVTPTNPDGLGGEIDFTRGL